MRLFSCATLSMACAAWLSGPKSLLADFVSGGAVVFTVVLTLVVFGQRKRGRE